MNNMLFMFNSLDERVDTTYHPKFRIVINNVSRYGDNYDPATIGREEFNNQTFASSDL